MINFALSSDPKGLKNDTRFAIALSESCIFDTIFYKFAGFFWGKRCGDVSVLMIQILSFSGRVGHTIHGVLN